jgi:hypothetical protein
MVHSKEWFYLDDDDDDEDNDDTNNNFACEQHEMQKILFSTVIKATNITIFTVMQALQHLLVVLSSRSSSNFLMY